MWPSIFWEKIENTGHFFWDTRYYFIYFNCFNYFYHFYHLDCFRYFYHFNYSKYFYYFIYFITIIGEIIKNQNVDIWQLKLFYTINSPIHVVFSPNLCDICDSWTLLILLQTNIDSYNKVSQNTALNKGSHRKVFRSKYEMLVCHMF